QANDVPGTRTLTGPAGTDLPPVKVKPLLSGLCDLMGRYQCCCVGSVRLSKRNIVRYAVRFTASVAVLGAAAIILAGVSAFAMRSSRALPFTSGLASSNDVAEPQMPNRALKTNRMAILLVLSARLGICGSAASL